jgi:hypothetical protein
MEQRIEYETLPVFVLDIPKSETDLKDADAVVAHFRARIEAHRCARFLGVFDHFSHTRSMSDGEIVNDIEDARCVVFCFGMSIPQPEILALRPRSIGIAVLRDRFVVTFLEPPMPVANSAMESWALAIPRHGRPGPPAGNLPDRKEAADCDFAMSGRPAEAIDISPSDRARPARTGAFYGVQGDD